MYPSNLIYERVSFEVEVRSLGRTAEQWRQNNDLGISVLNRSKRRKMVVITILLLRANLITPKDRNKPSEGGYLYLANAHMHLGIHSTDAIIRIKLYDDVPLVQLPLTKS